MTTPQFQDAIQLVCNLFLFFVIVYQYFVIKKQRTVIELQTELTVSSFKLVNSLEGELKKMHELSLVVTEKPKKKVAKKTKKVV